MTFLKKLGTILLRIVGIASGIMPLIQPVLPKQDQTIASTVTDKLAGIANVVITAEQMFAAAGIANAGSQKLAAATPFVAQIVQSLEMVSGKKPKDAVLFEKACTELTSAVADILNSFGE